MAVQSKYSGKASRDAALLGQFLGAAGSSVSLVSIVGESHVLGNTCIEFAGSGYRAKLVEYSILDLRLLRRCLQKSATVMFDSLYRFSMTDFIIVRLEGAKHRDWMASRHAFRSANVSGDVSRRPLFEVVGSIVDVWPLIVSFLKETGRKTNGDSLAGCIVYFMGLVPFLVP